MFAAPNDIASPSARAVNDVKLHFEKLVDDSGEVVFATLGELNPEYGITAGMLKSNTYKVYGELTLMMGVSETNLLAYREGDEGDGNDDDGIEDDDDDSLASRNAADQDADDDGNDDDDDDNDDAGKIDAGKIDAGFKVVPSQSGKGSAWQRPNKFQRC